MSRKPVKPQTKQELAHSYGVTARTLSNWINPHKDRIGRRQGHTYTPKQVQTIYEILGEPVHRDEEK